MPIRRLLMNAAGVGALALAAAGCSGNVTDGMKDGAWFSKPMNVITRADGSDAALNKNFDLGPRGAVAPEDFVGADGSCAASAAAAQASAPPAEAPAGSVAGDLAGSPMPQGAGAPLVSGGIALGMTECDAVRRAGTPANVAIGSGDDNERRVVLTYLSGPWPGIYTFSSGRLKEIAAAPVQAKPEKPVAKKKTAKAAKPKAAPAAPVIR